MPAFSSVLAGSLKPLTFLGATVTVRTSGIGALVNGNLRTRIDAAAGAGGGSVAARAAASRPARGAATANRLNGTGRSGVAPATAAGRRPQRPSATVRSQMLARRREPSPELALRQAGQPLAETPESRPPGSGSGALFRRPKQRGQAGQALWRPGSGAVPAPRQWIRRTASAPARAIPVRHARLPAPPSAPRALRASSAIDRSLTSTESSDPQSACLMTQKLTAEAK